MTDSALARPTLAALMGPALSAAAAGEMTLPRVSDLEVLQSAPIEGGPIPGFGVVTDPATGLRVILPSYRLVRGAVEYQEHFGAHQAALRGVADSPALAAAVTELALEDGVHAFLHHAFSAADAGGDEGLDEFLHSSLLPQAALTWALLDAYSDLVRGKLPEAGDEPLDVAEDMFGAVDPYGDEGRALVVDLWVLAEFEQHPASVHAPFEVQAARKLKPVSKKARKHAQRAKGH